MSGKTDWTIKVDVHQVYNLRLPGSSEQPSPLLAVSLGLPSSVESAPSEQVTGYKGNTSSATYNAVMVFSVGLTDQEFQRSKVTIKCQSYSLITQNLLIGACTFGFEKVYGLNRHLLSREWLPLTNPERPGEVNGYVQVSVGIFGPGDEVGASGGTVANVGQSIRSINERIVATPETAFNLCLLSVNIHRAEDLMKKTSKAIFGGSNSTCNPFVKVSFVGVALSTRVMIDTPSPQFNQTMRIPVLVPSWDQKILIEIFHQDGNDNILLGSLDLNFAEIFVTPVQPTWCNLYSVLGDANPDQRALSFLESEYAGRVLVSARCERSEEAVATVVGCEPAAEPQTMEITLWLDIYELSFVDVNVDKTKMPVNVWLQLDVGPQGFEFPKMRCDPNGTYLFGKKGTLQPLTLYIPKDVDTAYSLLISFFGEFTWGVRRLVFARIPWPEVMVMNSSPKWFKMLIAGLKRLKQDPVGANILATINAAPSALMPDHRPIRKHYEIGDFILRCFIYQACNLPITDPASLTDPLIRVSFAGVAARTEIVPVTLNPIWCESIDLEVSLPLDSNLRPDIFIELLDADDEGLVGVATLTVPLKTVTGLWKGPPKWYDLEPSPLYPNQNSKLLAAFELLTVENAKAEGDFGERMAPQVVRSSIQLYLVGIRLPEISETSKPWVEVSFGRKDLDPLKPQVKVIASKPETGSRGQLNFLQPIEIEVDVPVQPVYQQFLEVKVLQERDTNLLSVVTGADASDLLSGVASFFSSSSTSKPTASAVAAANTNYVVEVLGYGYVHLNPWYIWATEEERTYWQRFSSIASPESLREQAVLRAKKALLAELKAREDARKLQGNVRQNSSEEKKPYLKKLELEIEKRFGFNFQGNYETHNFSALPPLEVFHSAPPPRPGYSVLNSAHPGIQKFLRNFKWPEDLAGKDARREVDKELDFEFDEALMPFTTSPVVRGNQWGTFSRVGSLKYACRVSSDEMGFLQDEAGVTPEAWLRNMRKALEAKFASSTNLVVRLYVYAAEGVIPKGGSLDTEMYLSVRNGAPNTSNSIVDVNNVVTKTANPEFNKLFTLPCGFPSNSSLVVTLLEKRTLGDSPIGTAHIDLENRFFHPQYQAMLGVPGERTDVPNEVLLLRDHESFLTRGRVKARIEVMSAQASLSRPVEQLPSPYPEKMEVRLAVFGTRNVVPLEGEEQSHQQVSVSHQLSDGSLVEEVTDTHYGSLDGTAVFNWRIIINLEYPCPDTTLKIKVLHNPLIGSKTMIGEVSIDLLPDFKRVRKAKRGIEMPRSTLPVTHPAFPRSTRGYVDFELKIVTAEEALTYRAGVGREEPNMDPVLDGNDAVLLEHRSALANTVIGRKIGEITSSIINGAKFTFWLVLAAYVIGGIVWLIIMLKSLGII